MRITLITDASWCPEQRVGGYGYWVASKRGKRGGGGKCMAGGEVIDNTVAEMMAVCNSMFECYKSGIIGQGDEILIQTDCTAAISAFTGLRFKNLNHQEQMVVKYLYELEKALDLKLTFKHVKGHSELQDARSIANRFCDKTAKTFMRSARNVLRIEKMKQSFLNGVQNETSSC